jgi:hypothetical protein
LDVGGNDFEVPIEVVISKSNYATRVETITLHIVDRVNVLGDQPIVSEEMRRMSVMSDNALRNTNEVESIGLFRVSKNSKGSSNVSNFGLIPSLDVEGNKNNPVDSNLTYSCYPENGLTKCILTVRDYKLGPHTPPVGYAVSDAIGGDYVEISKEMKNNGYYIYGVFVLIYINFWEVNKLKKIVFIISMLALIGCQTYSPVVDPRSVGNEDRYYRDQAECQAIAKQGAHNINNTAKNTVVGGAVGTGAGALIGTIAGDTVSGLAYGAVIGGLAGAAKGVSESEQGYEQIYRNCMIGRGYNVLN